MTKKKPTPRKNNKTNKHKGMGKLRVKPPKQRTRKKQLVTKRCRNRQKLRLYGNGPKPQLKSTPPPTYKYPREF
eukprot:m.150522 g.150522  ORF g.150522 m.150522 type:complete len:74 (-) comp30730_c3_seq1:1763-1984(-)